MGLGYTLIASPGSFHLTGPAVILIGRHRTLTASTGAFVLSGKAVDLTYTPRTLSAGVGSFALTGIAVGLNPARKLKAGSGSFLLSRQYAGLTYSGQEITLRDELAADAPVVPDWFVPTMYSERPAVVQDVSTALGADSSYQHFVIVANYYNFTAKTWNDADYGEQHDGTGIPSFIKARVSEQEFLYAQYVTTDAAWLTAYQNEKEFQWAYYYADQALLRR